MLPFKSMLITRLWYEKQTVLPLSNQLLSLDFKRKWPQPSLGAKPALDQCAGRCTASSVGGSQAFLHLGFGLDASSVKSLRLVDILGRQWGDMDSNGRWLEGTGIAGSGGEAEGKPLLAIVLDLIFSKCWDVNATCHCESYWIFVMTPLINSIATTFMS